MSEEIKEILDKLSNRKQESLIQGLRECQLKDIEHPFITKEEYIDKTLDYITNLQQKYEKALELLSNYNMPCEIDNFMDDNSDYCSINCSNDGEVFKHCWNRFIEWKLKK